MTYSNMWPRGNWARRHLNWALVLYSWLALMPYFVVLMIGGSLGSDAIMGIGVAFALPAMFWGWYLMVWNLKHKGRSLWNILYLLIPWVGGIVFLCVGNRDQLADEIAKREEHEKGIEEYWKEHGGKPEALLR